MRAAAANQKAIDLLKALAEPIRLEIIESLSTGEKCVCDLMQEKLDIRALKSLQNWIKKLRKGCLNEVSSCE